MVRQDPYMDEPSFDLPTCYEGGIIPDGRGIPTDILATGADCGPSSLAAYLCISTAEAIRLLPLWKAKRRHSSQRTLDALDVVGKPHRRVNLSGGVHAVSEISDRFPAGIAEVRFFKQGKEFSIRHAIAYDRNRYGELLIYDNNARFEGIQGAWIPEESWLLKLPTWSRYWYRSVPAGHYLGHVLVPSGRG